MTKREKEEYLSSYKRLDNKINSLLSQCELWRARATKITPSYSDMPSAQNGTNRIETAVERIDELEQEMNSNIDELIMLKREIESKIDSVSDGVLKELLESRYIEGLTFGKIAQQMNYDIRHVTRLHEKAIQSLKI